MNKAAEAAHHSAWQTWVQQPKTGFACRSSPSVARHCGSPAPDLQGHQQLWGLSCNRNVMSLQAPASLPESTYFTTLRERNGQNRRVACQTPETASWFCALHLQGAENFVFLKEIIFYEHSRCCDQVYTAAGQSSCLHRAQRRTPAARRF